MYKKIKDFSTNGGNHLIFSGLSPASGQSNYDMVVSDQSSGQLYKMSMSGMGGHWQSDASGNPYVDQKEKGWQSITTIKQPN